MGCRDYCSEIAELNKTRVHIKDKTRVNEIVHKIVKGGFKKLQIVSDFDNTITKQHENGKKHLSSFGIFNFCPSIPKEYFTATNQLADKYKPIEMDPFIPLEEKKEIMAEWYKMSEEIIKGITVSLAEIDEVVAQASPSLRDGSKELFDRLKEANVPVLIFSAGLGDVVTSTLKHCEVLLDNVKVISNNLKFDKDGTTVVGFQGRMITIFNKNEYVLKDLDHFDRVLVNRTNVILMGDSLGDVGMVDGFEHAEDVLKIGFLYHNMIEDHLPSYTDQFDIVLEDDQTMDVINAIIRLMK